MNSNLHAKSQLLYFYNYMFHFVTTTSMLMLLCYCIKLQYVFIYLCSWIHFRCILVDRYTYSCPQCYYSWLERYNLRSLLDIRWYLSRSTQSYGFNLKNKLLIVLNFNCHRWNQYKHKCLVREMAKTAIRTKQPKINCNGYTLLKHRNNSTLLLLAKFLNELRWFTKCLYIPVQVNPSPVYPGRQVQVKLPAVLVHMAWAWQPPLFVEHSLISESPQIKRHNCWNLV